MHLHEALAEIGGLAHRPRAQRDRQRFDAHQRLLARPCQASQPMTSSQHSAADAVLHFMRHPARRRPERFDDGGDDEQREHAVEHRHDARGGVAQRTCARVAARREQRVADGQAGSAGEHDGRELERAMRDDEGVEVVAEAARCEVAGDRARVQAVEDQHDQRADAGEQAAGKGAKGDADVVHDVVAEHLEVAVGAALAAVGFDVLAVHLLVAAQRRRVVQHQRKAGLESSADRRADQRQGKGQRGHEHVPAMRAHRLRNADEEHARHAAAWPLRRGGRCAGARGA